MTDKPPTTDLELAELIAQVEQTAARTLLALGDLSPAFANITAGLPGYRSTTADHTPPEDFASILNDPAYAALRDIKATARAALRYVTTLRNQAAEWATADTPPPGPVHVDLDMWCESCLRIERCSPIHRGKLCRWCYDFNALEHQRPPIKLVKAHHGGIRITAAMVDEALGKKPKHRR